MEEAQVHDTAGVSAEMIAGNHGNQGNHGDRGLPRIYGSVQVSTDTEKQDMSLLLTPGPVHLPGINYRDPITGVSMPSYSRYPSMDTRPQGRLPGFHKSVHERSVFENTSYARSFYVIHPDWTSEASTARRLSVRARGQYAYDQRPCVQPLIDYILPTMEKRKEGDSLLRDTLSAAKSAAVERRVAAAQPPDYHALVRSSMSAISERSPPKGTGMPASARLYHKNLKNTHNLVQGSRPLPEKYKMF